MPNWVNYALAVVACAAGLATLVYIVSYATAGPLVDELSLDDLLGSDSD